MVLPSALREIERQLNVGYPISGFQIRGPWIKGALFPFDFKAFALACRNSVVTDIYGDEHDIIAEDIQMILTASQFKAHGYYKHIGGWDEYKRHFIANGLSFSVTQVSNRPKPESAVNYQFLQTLDRDKAAPIIKTNDKGKETIQLAPAIEALCQKSTEHLKMLRCDLGEVLKAFGAVEDNPNKKPLQEALMLYPRLLLDKGVKNEISRARHSAKKDFLKGKLLVTGFYGYAMPDLYGFCQYLFTGNTNPQGIIKPNEVYCNYYRDAKFMEVDLLRAPHLGNEHSIRRLSHRKICKAWFRHCGTNVIYSLQDYLMLACMGDVDGDSLFITPERALIDLVKPHSVLLYEMAKAPKKEVNDDGRFETLVNSFKCNDHNKGCTIGSISNTLTKIWNADTITPELADLVKYLVMLNNYTIDYPKTQKALDLPAPIQEQYEKVCKALPPHFFKWAKGKKKVDKLNNSIMSQVVKCVSSVKETRLTYFKKEETFDYSMLQRRTAEGGIYGVDRYSPVYKEIHTKLYSIGEEAQQLKQIIEAKQKKAWESGRKEIGFELFYELQNAITLEILLNLCGQDGLMLTNILVDIHYNQEPITNLHNVIWKCTGNVIVENLRLNLGMSDYKPMIRQRKAYNKLSALVREAEIEREQRKAVIYEHDMSQLQEIEDNELRKLYFALLVEAKRNPSHTVTLTRNQKGLTFQKLVAKAGFERWTNPRKEGEEKKLVPCMPRKQAIRALEARGLIKLQRDKARSGDTYALPRASFEQAGDVTVTIEPGTLPRTYYENLFNGKELVNAICVECQTPFLKNGNAQKTCSPECSMARRRRKDSKRKKKTKANKSANRKKPKSIEN